MSNALYQDSFANARPNLTYQAVAARLSLTRALTQDLASYYHERAQVEDAYVKSLQKLSTRLHQAGSHTVFSAVEQLGLDKRDEQRQLAAWNTVRSRLEAEINELAKVHDTWRKKTLEEVESPLRQSLSKPEWQRWQQGEATIGSTVKEYESTLDKVQKAQSKESTKSSKSTSSKLLTAQSQLSTLGSSLKSALPAFLATSQKLDESHHAFLKEALVLSGTFTSDLGRERMEAGERLLVSVLGVDEQAEIQGWALRESMRAGGNTAAGGPGQISSTNLNEFGTTSLTSASGWNGAREESIAEEPDQNQRTPTQERVRASSNARNMPPPVAPLPLPTPPPPKSSGGGFKLSKILKRDRASSGAASSKYGNLEVPQSSGEGYRGGADRRSLDSRDSTSITGGPEPATRSSLAPQPPRMDRTNSGSSSLMGGSSSGAGMQPPIMPSTGSNTKKRESLMPFASGGLFRRASRIGSSPTTEAPEQEGGLGGYGQGTPSTSRNGTTTVDEEGYSVPPAGYDKQPWETTNQGSSNLMDDDDDDEAADTAAPLQASRVPAVALAPAVITEDESERQAALEKVQSTLLSAGPATGLSRRATRGRRDNRMSSAFGATGAAPVIPDDMPLAQAIERQQRSRETSIDSPTGSAVAMAPPLSASSLGRMGSPTFGSDRAMSMVSTTSQDTTRRLAGGADPFEHSTTPGLRAFIVETVNVLSKGGEITRVMITGEVHLSHRVESGSPVAPMRIRVAQFETFEKAAPNSTYLAPVAGSLGEFDILPSLAAKHGSTLVVLKYQVHVASGQEARYVPLSVKAMWKCEASQTRLIVTYKANELPSILSSPFGEDDDEDIKDLEFAIPISAPVSTFQAKPALARWNVETSRLTFSIDEGVSSKDPSEHKLLASVQTEGTAQAQPLAVKWTIEGRCLSAVGVEAVGGSERVVETRKAVVAGKFLVAP